MSDAILFKTCLTGFTTVQVNPNNIEQIQPALMKKMQSAPKNFFKAQPFVADLNNNATLSSKELLAIKASFNSQELILIGVTNHQLDIETISQAGLASIDDKLNAPAVSNDKKAAVNTKEKLAEATLTTIMADNSTKTKVIRRPVRSGQRIYAPNGDLVVIGTVGAGAEVIADGNIFILGTLRGRAFAGAKGDNKAFIYCHELNAELVSIGGNYQTMEQIERHKSGMNKLISLIDDEVMDIFSL